MVSLCYTTHSIVSILICPLYTPLSPFYPYFSAIDQDTHLQTLSTSLNRQHSISLAINTELEEHHGLLEELDTELEGTHSRLGGARRRLERVGRGVKGNGAYL